MSSPSDKKQPGADDHETEPRDYASPPCYQHELDPNYLGTALAEDKDADAGSAWDTVQSWRVATRSQLRTLRRELNYDERARCTKRIVENLQNTGVFSRRQRVGFYWPMAGEIDLRPLMTALTDQGVEAALPVIIEPKQPLEFWAWHPGDKLDESGPWGIPAPATRQLVEVDVLLIPLLGFDDRRHRLGHGGGYYDRTLSEMDPRPVTVGIGLEICRLPSIYPQAHDVAMDLIVTDAGSLGQLQEDSSDVNRRNPQ